MLEPTTDEFNEEVCRMHNTSVKQVRQDVEVLKEWIRQQPHLPQCSSDTLLTGFLISSKNSMERAKQKIDNYYTTKLDIPDFFSDRDPLNERYRNICEVLMLCMLPKHTPDGCLVAFVSLLTGDASRYDVQAIGKQTMIFADVVYNDVAYMKGASIVMDCGLISPAHLVRITPSIVRDLLRCMQDFMPIILKDVIVINCSGLIDVVMNLCRPFVKGKFMQKVHLHTEGAEILTKYLPKEMIPSDYGGYGESTKTLNEKAKRIILENRDWLLNEGSATVDESKRIRDINDQNELSLMGGQGSFKTLCVD